MKRIHFATAKGLQSGLLFGNPNIKPSLVFAHANGMHARAYAPLLEVVAQEAGKTILGLDLRGHGESRLSPLNATTARWPNMAKDYLAAIEALDLTDLTLAGHSIGATLSLMVAARAPERVKNLSLFDPVLLPNWFHFCASVPIFNQVSRLHPMVRKARKRQAVFDSLDEARQNWQKARVFKSWADGFFEAYLAGALHPRDDGQLELACPPHFEVHCFRQLQFRPRRLVVSVPHPTDVLVAAHGSTLMAGVRAHIDRHCPNFAISVAPNTGHFLPMQAPKLAIAALTKALG